MEETDTIIIKEQTSKDNTHIEECSICLDNLKYKVSTLSCNHEFHYECLSNWQKKKNCLIIICPICRQEVEMLSIKDKCKKKGVLNQFYDIDLNTNEDFNKINEPNNQLDNITNQYLIFNCCSIL